MPSSLVLSATFNAEPLRAQLERWGPEHRLPFPVALAPYQQLIQQLRDPGSLSSTNVEGVNVLLVRPADWLRFQGAGQEREHLRTSAEELVDAVRRRAAPAAVPHLLLLCPSGAGAERERAREAEQLLESGLASVDGVLVVRSALALAEESSSVFDPDAERLGHVPYTESFHAALARLIARAIHSIVGPARPVLALDADALLSEARASRRPASRLQAWHGAGGSLCLVSSQDEAALEQAFQAAGDALPIGLDHVWAVEAGPAPLEAKLRALCERLGVGPDRMVFLSDRADRCAEASSIPGMLAPRATGGLDAFAGELWALDPRWPWPTRLSARWELAGPELERLATGRDESAAMPGGQPAAAPATPATGPASEPAPAASAMTAREQELAALWGQILGKPPASSSDDFMELGGSSLQAVMLMARVSKKYAVKLKATDLRNCRTLASQAQLLDRLLAAAKAPAKSAAGAPAQPAANSGPVALPRDRALPPSFSQERMLFLEQLQGAGAHYVEAAGVRLRGPLDAVALERAFNEVLARHEVLRAGFTPSPEGFIQRVSPPAQVAIPLDDLQGLPRERQLEELDRIGRQCASLPFDLATGPMLRARLVRQGPEEHVLVLAMHHLATDLWSFGILSYELGVLYDGFRSGRPAQLAPLPIQYADYAAWQRQWLSGQTLERELQWWQKRLEGLRPLSVPSDRRRPARWSGRGARRPLRLGAELTKKLEALARQRSTTLFSVLLAGWDALLGRLTDSSDFAVGTLVANRTRPELEGLIGFFANTVVLRSDLGGDPSFDELIARVSNTVLEALDHQEVPFEKVVEAVNPERDLSRVPLAQVVFMLQTLPAAKDLFSSVDAEAVTFESGAAKFDLTTALYETPSGLEGEIEYATDLFDAATVDRLGGQYVRLLEAAVAQPATRLSRLPIVDGAEREQVVYGWNDTDAPYDRQALIPAAFERRARAEPDRPALQFEQRLLRYGELNALSNRIAHWLRGHGVGRGERVAIYLGRSLEMIPALLAVLKAGGTYVPLDVAWPAARVQSLLRAMGCRIVLSHQARLEALGTLSAESDLAHALLLDAPDGAPASGGMQIHGLAALEGQPETDPAPINHPLDPAYVIFTSGSTGTPKGVVVAHRPVINLIEWLEREYGFGPSDRVLFVNSLCFDLSVFDAFGLLSTGGSIRIASAADLAEPTRLLELIDHDGITFWDSAPAALQRLMPLPVPRGERPASSLRLAFLSGDWVPLNALAWLNDRFPGARLIALGGATEATVWSNHFPVRKVEPQWASIPYGRPMPNARYYVLDRRLEPVPVGVPGDLYIAGECLATGYADPALTASKFLPDPFSRRPGERMYFTGDQARFMPDGNLEFLGRLDSQVKIRGYRIELGEVEAALAQVAGVDEAIALVREDVPGDRRLVAYVGSRAQPPPTAESLRAQLARTLPEYELPAAYVVLESLPRSATGKFDRKALPAPALGRPARAEPVAPRDELEAAVARVVADLLHRPSVGIDDNFFELGGNSLLAVSLIASINARFGRQLPLATLFEARTVAELAERVRRADRAGPWSPLVPLRTGREAARPLFLIHPIGGSALCYLDLASQLPADSALWGLQAAGLDGERPPMRDLDQMADCYARAVREAQPRGPYRIGGWSFGGLAAFRVAQLLESAGESVERVLLIDPTPPLVRMPLVDASEVLAFFAADLAARTAGSGEIARHLGDRLQPGATMEQIVEALVAAAVLPPQFGVERARQMLEVFRGCLDAERRFQAGGPIDAPMLLVQAAETPDASDQWKTLTRSGLRSHRLEGDHYSIVGAQGSGRLAKLLGEVL